MGRFDQVRQVVAVEREAGPLAIRCVEHRPLGVDELHELLHERIDCGLLDDRVGMRGPEDRQMVVLRQQLHRLERRVDTLVAGEEPEAAQHHGAGWQRTQGGEIVP